jgi:hypothetical protein
MRKTNPLSLAILFSFAALAPVLLPRPAAAQDAKPTVESKQSDASPAEDRRYYRLDFNIREIGEDGKVTNSRAYSIIAESDSQHPDSVQPSSIRTGSRIAVPVYSETPMHYQFQEVGVNLDCRRVYLVHGQLSLHISAEVSSLADASASNTPPVTRQNKWESDAILPLDKPTVLFWSDNVAAKGKLQLELTATSIR